MQEGDSVPAIRFSGFIDDWEQRKLGEVAEKTFGGGTPNTSNEAFWNGKIPWIQSSDVTDGKVFELQPKKYITTDGLNKSAAQLVPADSIAIITRVGVGKLVFVPFSYTTSQDFLSLSKLKTEPFFTVYACYKKIQSELNEVQGTSIKGITKNELLAKEIMVPDYAEQYKIGDYFKNLDLLITLHQRKYSQLCNIKRSMLEKMFPREGATVPEIRFAGFTEAWEQCKVGDFYDFKNGLNKGKEFFGKGTPIVNFTDVFHKRGINMSMLHGRVALSPSEISNYEVQQGDIFFTRTSETIDEIGYASVMLDDPKDTVFSGFVLRGRAMKEDPLTLKFKQYVFSTDEFRSEMIKKSSMTTRALTSGTAIRRMYFKYPSNMEEQDLIGQFFDDFNHLITLHQRELERLQNIKKACLEKMFL